MIYNCPVGGEFAARGKGSAGYTGISDLGPAIVEPRSACRIHGPTSPTKSS